MRIYVYVKFDTRQQAEGIRVDHISNTFLDRDFYISTFDYDALKAIAVRVQAKDFHFIQRIDILLLCLKVVWL